MTGNAYFTYTQKDLISLIKGDIMAKFGQRELQGIDINCPDIYTCEAVYTPECAEPEIEIKNVSTIIGEIVPQFARDKAYRRDDSIFLVDGIEGVTSEYIRSSVVPVLKIKGGPVQMRILRSQKAPGNAKGERGYWVPVAIKPPANAPVLSNATSVLPYTLNTVPKSVLVTPVTAKRGYIVIWMDASYTTSDLVINWDSDICPESIHVDMSEVSLQDADFPRKRAIPSDPEITVKPTECECAFGALSANAKIQITCDLNKGK